MWVEHLATAGLTVLVYMTAIWILSLILKNASIVDIFWGLGFVLLAWEYFFITEGLELRRLIVVAITTLWGVRLSSYIAIRNHGKGEDKRYAKWRREGGSGWWLRSYVTVFLFQGVLMLIISAPLYFAQRAALPSALTWLDYTGLAVALLGLGYEAIADWQLFRFKQRNNNGNGVYDGGLWRFSRHPNYFGEMLVWWGLFGLAALTPNGWVAIVSPVLLTFFLLKVSGVSLLESDLKNAKPGYREYMKKTNAFIPGAPKAS